MNNSLRRVPALLLLLLLCGCGRGGETAEIRYYRLASGQSANHLANQACERFCSLVEKESGGAIQIIPSFENELGTDASALEQCVYGGIDFVRTPLSAAAAYAPQLSALQLPYEYTSDEHLFRVLDGDVGADAMDSLEEQGLTGLSYFYAGYRCFFTTDKTGSIVNICSMTGKKTASEKFASVFLCFLHNVFRLFSPSEEAAEAMGMSSFYFSRFFRTAYNRTFLEYLTSYRIERAEELLRQTDIPVREIAPRVGYTDANYFTKVFKRHCGCTPTD